MIFSLRSSLRMQNYADRPRRAIPCFRYFGGRTPLQAHCFSVAIGAVGRMRRARPIPRREGDVLTTRKTPYGRERLAGHRGRRSMKYAYLHAQKEAPSLRKGERVERVPSNTLNERDMQSILVVEDEKRVADLLKIGLEENGYQVVVAYDARWGCACSGPTPSSWSSQTSSCPS